MSGGRATVAKGKVRQAGDITAVAPEGHILSDNLYMECKHLKKITLDSLITGKGDLINIWNKTIEEAAKYDRIPFLIFRQNRWPTLICTNIEGIEFLHLEFTILAQSKEMFFIKFDEMVKQPFALK